MQLAIHDLLSMSSRDTTASIFDKTKQLVQATEELGYTRYWFAEHHSIPQHASSAPEILTAYFLAITKKMRIGTGGTMIMHYPALHIAEQFKTMAALEPGRVDIGFGRAPGGGPSEIVALQEGSYNYNRDLYGKMRDIMAYFEDRFPRTTYLQGSRAVPEGLNIMPQPWMLGSTGNSAPQAAQMGLPYSFVHWFGNETPVQIFDQYRKEFQVSAFASEAKVSVSYKVLVAENEDALEELKIPFDAFHIMSKTGNFQAIPTFDEVKDYKYTPAQEKTLAADYANHYIISGTPDQVEEILRSEVERIGIDELMFYTPVADIDARIKSYELLAKMFL